APDQVSRGGVRCLLGRGHDDNQRTCRESAAGAELRVKVSITTRRNRWQTDRERSVSVVRPETVLRWHRQGRCTSWRFRSRYTLGRPRVSPEVRVVIATMAGQNLHWGTEPSGSAASSSSSASP